MTKFPVPSVYLVTNKELSLGRQLAFIVEEAVQGGCRIVQYREKNFNYKVHLQEAYTIRDICRKFETLFIVNDRVDLALVLDSDGVHLGQSDMPPDIARSIIGSEKCIGLSIETMEDLNSLIENKNILGSLNYLALSPIYPTPTKTDTREAWGIEKIQEIATKIDLPLVGIGGLNTQNISKVVWAGIDSIALVSEICSSNDPRETATELNDTLKKVYNQRILGISTMTN